jgi:hypothetical protein
VRSRQPIFCLEAINLVIAVKTLVPSDLQATRVIISTDNAVSASVLLTGRGREPILTSCAREIAQIAALQSLVFDVHHMPGESLVLADTLSRIPLDRSYADLAARLVKERGLTRADPIAFSGAIDTNCLSI